MLAVRGIFENGKLILNKKINISKPVEVIVTFLDDISDKEKKTINLQEFSFMESQKILKNYKGSLSDSIIKERKNER